MTAASRHNKADDAAFTRPLAKALQRHAAAMTPPADRRDGPAALRAHPGVRWLAGLEGET